MICSLHRFLLVHQHTNYRDEASPPRSRSPFVPGQDLMVLQSWLFLPELRKLSLDEFA